MSLISQEELNPLIESIYQSALVTGDWEDFLSACSQSLGGGVRMAMHVHDIRHGVSMAFVSSNYDPSFIESYKREYAGLNPWSKAAFLHPVGVAMPSEALVDPADLRKGRFYNEWIRPQEDVMTGGGITLSRNSTSFARISCNMRRKDQDPVQERMLSLLNFLYPHFRQAIKLRRHLLEIKSIAPLQSLASNCEAVIALDSARRVIGIRDEFMWAQFGIRNCRIGQRLEFFSHCANGSIAQAMELLANGFRPSLPKSLEIRLGDDRKALKASLIIVGHFVQPDTILDRIIGEQTVAILVLSSPATPTVLDLAQRFGLTPAEARLSHAIIRGQSLRQYAVDHGLQIGSVRQVAKLILQKSGTHRQSEFVALACLNGASQPNWR